LIPSAHDDDDDLADDDPEAVAAALRATFAEALDRMGGAQTLADWAHERPAQFCLALTRLFTGPGARQAAAAPAAYAYFSDTPLPSEPLTEEAWLERVRTEAAQPASAPWPHPGG